MRQLARSVNSRVGVIIDPLPSAIKQCDFGKWLNLYTLRDYKQTNQRHWTHHTLQIRVTKFLNVRIISNMGGSGTIP